MHSECIAWRIIQESPICGIGLTVRNSLYTKTLAYIQEEIVIISVGDVDWCVAAHLVFSL